MTSTLRSARIVELFVLPANPAPNALSANQTRSFSQQLGSVNALQVHFSIQLLKHVSHAKVHVPLAVIKQAVHHAELATL